MTELAVRIPPTAGSSLVEYAAEASSIYKFCEVVSSTSFVPKSFQGRPDEVMAAVMFGRSIGMDPMVALQSVHVIEGRPSLSALAMRGKAQAGGVKFRYDEMTQTRCRISARAPGDDAWTSVMWDLDRAKKLGLATKSNWIKQPQAMLIARSTSELCRLVAANVFLGHEYSVEELRDGGPAFEETWTEASPEPAAKVTVQRKPRTVPARVDYPQPEPESATVVPFGGDSNYDTRDVPVRQLEAPGTVVGPGIDVGVRKALMAKFNEAGIGERSKRLEFVSNVLGREINSVNQIDTDEGKRVLRALDELPGDAADVPQPQ